MAIPRIFVLAIILTAIQSSLCTFIPTTEASPPSLRQTAASNISACRISAPRGVYLSLGFSYTEIPCAPSTGTLRAFMFFVDFSDAPAPSSETPQQLYDFFLPAANEWYKTSSYGRLTLNVTADMTRFARMPARSDSYNWNRGLTSATHRTYILDAIDAYARVATVPTGYDVLYIVPTTKATAISFSPTYMDSVEQRGSRTAKQVAGKVVTIGLDAYQTWKSKVINHETGHTMCLPDLYPVTGATGLYIGGWDMMGYINGPSPDYFAWSKWRLGWIDDAQVECVADGKGSSVHVLSALESNDEDIKAVVVRHNATTVLVAEARTKLGVDDAACATGVLLYTVSMATETGRGPVRVLDVNPSGNGCAGDKLNDAPLSLAGTSSFTVPGWGVKVTLTAQSGNRFTIQVDVS
ncbi:hypothetical protein B0H66DRAFT_590376 [Apodospora peruviana]|uniref:M6 metalloprotease n=1 Tax=Apodospora peruviana TaxID=516989 RepID=A0AAE0M8P7_9PEZI|nr:hypothetical protein B0H66DRAFT_590376 [Apodospora peruviana]